MPLLSTRNSFLNNFPKSIEFIIILLLVIYSLISAKQYLDKSNIFPEYYQHHFGPAVMKACGKGFINPDFINIPKLNDFLNLKTSSFSCNDIHSNAPSIPFYAFQEFHQYLLYSASYIWSISEISWNALSILSYIFLGFTCIFSYFLFRLGMGRLFSILFTILFTTLPFHQSVLPHLRDYVKAPFILAILLIIGLFVKYSFNKYVFVILSALAGIVIGVGLGFRMDIFIMIPFYTIVLFFFTPFGFSNKLQLKFIGIIVFGFLLLITGWPILKLFGSSSNTFHVILLGLTTPFNSILNIDNSIYELLYSYNDGYISAVVGSYAHRFLDKSSSLLISTNDYDPVCLKYYLDILFNFPADILLRFYSAIIKILSSPFSSFSNISIIISFLSVIIISLKTWRVSLLLFLSFFYLCGYPSLQFAERHYFHLFIIPLWLIGFFINHLCIFISRFFHYSLFINYYNRLITECCPMT